ncbi:hypothetical protein E8E13_010585 [Curvularia kusanoi]|uniref:Cupin type-1 domain-containing protein n=1 Tax=Curvularia kusanoi TaxID=90978 RepID=A0A9P4TL19_CURKU|nr:hypothetical protein E8E13_010585 [Curvularia kusanoi]
MDGNGRGALMLGFVPNLKWRFSDARTRIYPGGWVREQVDDDLPQSKEISAAQQHLKKGAIRELHWHRVAEWGQVLAGRVLLSTVDEIGRHQVAELQFGDIYYFPKGEAHTLQGLDDENELLLAFDDGNFDAAGTTFNVDDWLARTPKSILAKSLGVPESAFDELPQPNPYIQNSATGAPTRQRAIVGGAGELAGNDSRIYRTFSHAPERAPGGAGVWWKMDSTYLPVAKTLASTYNVLKPKSIRELHWHTNVDWPASWIGDFANSQQSDEWVYFHKGTGRATIFTGNGNARTFDFGPGDTAIFPAQSGHYIENTSATQNLTWIEIHKTDRVADMSLTQWMALTPADIVADVLNLPLGLVENFEKEKQIFIRGD